MEGGGAGEDACVPGHICAAKVLLFFEICKWILNVNVANEANVANESLPLREIRES